MKNLLRSEFMPLIMAGLGVLGFLLRRGLYAVAVDHKDLLLAGHPLQWGLFLVTAAAIALAVCYGMAKEQGGALSGTRLSAVGYIALAAGILIALLPEGFGGNGLAGLRTILGILVSLAMAAGALQRFRGQKVFFLVPGLGCVFFAVHMVSCYQGWSSNPQILDYLYTLLASVSLMLFAYQQSACAANCGSGKLLRLFGSLSVFCGITALSGTEFPVLYLTGSFWALTVLCCPDAAEASPNEENQTDSGEEGEGPLPEETE